MIYPNPCKDIVYFKSENPIVGITISDINGRIVLTKRDKNIESVNLGEYPSGMYYIEILYKNSKVNIQKIYKIK
ncbi:MAG: T9SS type A sorting domain-containing protein [Saprospiraceae bacterium]|nr:T9SS type A sorting domain-containing protein [Saprospiraceae bacterium]